MGDDDDVVVLVGVWLGVCVGVAVEVRDSVDDAELVAVCEAVPLALAPGERDDVGVTLCDELSDGVEEPLSLLVGVELGVDAAVPEPVPVGVTVALDVAD